MRKRSQGQIEKNSSHIEPARYHWSNLGQRWCGRPFAIITLFCIHSLEYRNVGDSALATHSKAHFEGGTVLVWVRFTSRTNVPELNILYVGKGSQHNITQQSRGLPASSGWHCSVECKKKLQDDVIILLGFHGPRNWRHVLTNVMNMSGGGGGGGIWMRTLEAVNLEFGVL